MLRTRVVPVALLLLSGCSLSLDGLAAGDASAGAPSDAAIDATLPDGDDAVAPGDDATGVDALSDAPAEGPPSPMPGWTRWRALTIHNDAFGALADFPLLVALKPTRIDYAHTQAQGQDLRFVGDTGDLLPYEIERFGMPSSWVWVKVPQIPAHATKTIWMFYGNPTALDAQNATGVWDAHYVGVWHLADGHDSTGKHASAAINAPKSITGVVGPAMHFDGKMQYVETGSADQLSAWTVEVFSNADAPPNQSGWYGPLMRDEDYGIGWDCNTPWWPSSAQAISVYIAGTCNQGWCTAEFAHAGTPTALQPGTWYHLAATFDGQTLAAYTNGALFDGHAQPGTPGQGTSTAKIGANESLTTHFPGSVDEARISDIVRSADWISAQYASMTDTYVTYGPEEVNP